MHAHAQYMAHTPYRYTHNIVHKHAQNPMMWSLFVAIIISCSGLRKFLDPESPDFYLEVGWITSLLRWIAGTTGRCLLRKIAGTSELSAVCRGA